MTTTSRTDASGSLPSGWRWVKLGKVCRLNPSRPSIDRADHTLTTFVPMSAVDDQEGIIAHPDERTYGEIKRGYTYFADGDVLFAKITPCMQNGKHAIALDLVDGIGFGSTEFHVIRPGSEICAEWIHFFVRQPNILKAATAHFTGSVGQQRVPEGFLANLDIPLAPLAEQKRIVAILNDQLAAVETARAAAVAQLAGAKALPAAYLRQMFPRPGQKLPAGWRWTNLGQLVTRRTDMVHPYDRPQGKGIFVGLEHIESGTGVRIGALPIELGELQGRKPRFSRGDLVYGYLRPYLNKVWVADLDGYCSVDQYVFRVNQREADEDYVASYMRSPIYLALAPIKTTPGQLPRIRSEEVGDVPIPLPPLQEQRQIMVRLEQALTACKQAREALETQIIQLDALPTAYLGSAFRGEQ